MQKNAFTLVELLVVIAILAILAAIAFPFVRSSIEKGQSAKCMANLRELGALINGYAAEKGHYPPNKVYNPQTDTYQNFPPWFTIDAWSGNKDSSVWLCPSRSNKSGFLPAYTFNTRVFNVPELKVVAVPRPSQVIAIIDAGQRANGWAFHQLSVPGATNPADADKPLTGSPITAPNLGISPGPCVCYRHQGFANALFVDGHVEAKKLGTILERNISTSY